MERRSRVFFVAGVASMAALALMLAAQGPSSGDARIQGRVLDIKGQPVAGASVSLARSGTSQSIFSVTHADGTYSFANAESGVDYELKAGHEGLASRVKPLRLSEEKLTIDLMVIPPIRFQDVSQRAGLNFVLRNGAS